MLFHCIRRHNVICILEKVFKLVKFDNNELQILLTTTKISKGIINVLSDFHGIGKGQHCTQNHNYQPHGEFGRKIGLLVIILV